MVVPLPPAYPPATMMAEQKPSTPFQAYLSSKREGGPVGPPASTLQPFQSPSKQAPGAHGANSSSPSPQRRSSKPGTPATQLQQAASSWLQANKGQQANGRAAQALAVSGAPAAPQEYSSLAQAAATLAHAARSLAQSPLLQETPPGGIRDSYQALAVAAEELATNVTVSTGSRTGPQAQASPSKASPGLPPKPPAGQGAGSGTTVFDPLQQQRGSFAPFVSDANGTGAGGGGSTGGGGRLSTPKFPPVNPLVAFRTSELPRPGTAAAAAAAAAQQGNRPPTANPITHTFDDLRPSTSARGSTAGLGGGWPSASPPTRRTPGPGDAGSEVAQVLAVVQGSEGGAGAGGASGAGGAQGGRANAAEAMNFVLKHPERVRLAEWPPKSPYTESEIQDDDLALKYNGALAAIRERIRSHGVGGVARAFKGADGDGSGSLDPREFKQVVRSLDLGPAVDDQVLDLIVANVDGDHDGRINYSEFIGAVRFNTLPYKQYNPKFRHRAAGNPDQPFGAPNVNFPYGTLQDGQANTANNLTLMDEKFAELAKAFTAMDKDKDGVIDFGEFKEAMKHMDARFNLQLEDAYIAKVFREADWDYSRGINYKEFMDAFAGSASTRFVPEFLKPKSLRSSQLGAPWEWRGPRLPPPPGALIPEGFPYGGFPAGYQSKVGVGIGNANPDCEGGLRPMNKGPDGLAAPIGTGVGPGLVPPPLLRPGTSLAAHAQPRLMAAGGLGSRPGTAGSTAAVANGSLPTGRLTADSSKLLKRLK